MGVRAKVQKILAVLAMAAAGPQKGGQNTENSVAPETSNSLPFY